MQLRSRTYSIPLLTLATLLITPFINKFPFTDYNLNQLSLLPSAMAEEPEEEADPAEVAIGERLFLDDRFSYFFYFNSGGQTNQTLTKGDPIWEELTTNNGRIQSPFRGQSTSCASCHLVDQAFDIDGGGMRTYADFAAKSPVSARSDKHLTSLRNSQAMVHTTIERPDNLPMLLHHDGEFLSMESLVKATLTGRNMGWLPGEGGLAQSHIARVIREDDGTGELAEEFGGAYKLILAGTDPTIPEELRLPEEYRIDVTQASDQEILDALSKIMTAYIDGLRFLTDESGAYTGSPYDQFLEKNKLPKMPKENESSLSYSRRLLGLIQNLKEPIFITSGDGQFATHNQEFVFGPKELEGLKIFFNEKLSPNASAGACIQCHTAPHFTDFLAHNIGTAQFQYEVANGYRSFERLKIPSYREREAQPDLFGIANDQHPNRLGLMRSFVTRNDPRRVDLGLWNYIANPDYSQNQEAYMRILSEVYPEKNIYLLSRNQLVELSIGLFRTPTLRDLGHSAPYFHTGHASTIHEAVAFYFALAHRARKGQLRASDPRILNIAFNGSDVEAIEAFIQSLNEDYE